MTAESGVAAPSAMAAPSTGSIWTDRNFVRLWTGESISAIGNQITQFTLPLVAILTLHASTFQVGVLNACRTAPVVVVSLFAGVWLDRRRRRPILIACSLGNAVLIALVPISDATGLLGIGLLYLVSLAVGVLSVVFDIGVLSYVPTLVERRHLADSNSKLQLSTSLSLVAGPGLAGALVGVLTAPITLSADAFSYLCSAAGLILIDKPEEPPEAPGIRPSIRSSIAEGLRAVYGSPILRSLLNLAATFNFVQAGFITIFVVYGIRVLHLGPFRLGVVLGAIAVGGIVGAMMSSRVSGFFGIGPTMLVGLSGATLCPLLLLIPRDAGLASMSIMIGAELLYGFGVLSFNVITVTVRQTVTPNRLLGRMNASYRMVLFGMAPLGSALAGVLGQHFGLRTALVIAVLAFPSAILWTISSPVVRMREMPAGPAEDLLAAPAPGPSSPAADEPVASRSMEMDESG
ncbi:MAG TPA: MFS transporter [Jatrophihabitans sp.]|nr:MFS transporter [Jatrophihabitans sp.]